MSIMSAIQQATEKVRKARRNLDDFCRGFELQIAECKRQIAEADAEIKELESLKEVMGGELADEHEFKLLRLAERKGALDRSLPFHLDWVKRQEQNFELPRLKAEIRRAYQAGVALIFNEIAMQKAKMRVHGKDAYSLSEIFENAAKAGELIREGYAEFGYFEVVKFEKLSLDEFNADRPADCTWPVLPDWEGLGQFGFEIPKGKKAA